MGSIIPVACGFRRVKVQRVFGLYTRVSLGFCCAAALVSQPLSALAQPDLVRHAPSSTMSALALDVVENNPEIMAQRHQVRIAKARLQSAIAGFLPTIEANGLVQKRVVDVKNGGPGDANFVAGQASIEARLRVYDGDRTANAVRVAQAELASAEAVLEAIISDILLELLTSAADVQLDRKIREYTEMQSEAIGEQLRSTSRRIEFGESTKTDENLARARLATSEAGVLAANEQLNVNGYRFRTVSGLSATVVPPLPALAPAPESLTKAQNLATDASPRLRAAQFNEEASRNGVKFSSGALLPQLDAVGGYEFLTGGVANLFTGKLPDDRSALFGGIELRVPVFQPRDHVEIRRAVAFRDMRVSQQEMAAKLVAEEVASSWTRWQSAKSTIVLAEAAVAAIQQAVEGIKKESIGGSRTLTDVLNAENELLSARITLERAFRNEFVARASVHASTGKLSADTVLAASANAAMSEVDRPALSALGQPVEKFSIANVAEVDGNPNRPPISALGGNIGSAESEADLNKAAAISRPKISSMGR